MQAKTAVPSLPSDIQTCPNTLEATRKSGDRKAIKRGAPIAQRIIAALKKGKYHQFKLVATYALRSMGPEALPVILEGLKSPSADVREICVRTLRGTMLAPGQRAQIYEALRKIMLDPKEDPIVRTSAIDYLVEGYGKFITELPENQRHLVADMLSLIGDNAPTNVELRAAERLERMVSFMPPAQKKEALDALEKLFRQYGDNSDRPDAAYGWRIAGNAILSLKGKERLEAMRTQTEDKWLAWNAYEVVYLFQDQIIKNKVYIFNEVSEQQAVTDHKKYAPAFPGWRKW